MGSPDWNMNEDTERQQWEAEIEQSLSGVQKSIDWMKANNIGNRDERDTGRTEKAIPCE